MKLHPLFKHFGSSYLSARHYPPPLPGLPLFEPYAGSAGYALNHADFDVVLWEDDWHLHSLWSWLINEATAGLVREIPCGLPEGSDIRDLCPYLCFGQQLLLKHWQRTNNVGHCWTISAWGNKSGQWTENTRARVAEEVQAVKHWKLAKIGFDEVGTYFVDPPYFYNYQYRFPKTNRFNHADLARTIGTIPHGSRIIVTEATCPKTGAVPDYLPFAPSHRQVTSRRSSHHHNHSNELIFWEDR